MEVRIARSGRKHKIGKARILAAMQAAGTPTLVGEDQLLFVGVDDRGVKLEIIAVPDDSGRATLTVIHAMPTLYRER